MPTRRTDPNARANLLALARQLLAAVEGEPQEPIRVLVQSAAGTRIVVEGQAPDQAAGRELAATERQIVAVCGSQPLSPKQINARLPRRLNPRYLSSLLTGLWRKGHLQRTPAGGYRVTPPNREEASPDFTPNPQA
jgi:hypothetical protein